MEKLTLKATLSPALQAKLEEMQKLKKTEKGNFAVSAKNKPGSDKSSESSKEPSKGNQPKDWKGHLEKIRKMQLWLEETWPNTFNLKNPKPLKRHIEIDIVPHLPPPFTKTQLRRSLQAYVSRKGYLDAIINDGGRYDLTGERIEEIPEDQKEFSRQKLEAKQLKYEEHQNKKKERRKKFSRKAGDKSPDKTA